MKRLKRLMPLALVILVWSIGSCFLNQLFLPTPQRVFNTLIDMAKSGLLQEAAVASLIRITIASLIAAFISIPLALIVANYRLADDLITPVTGFMRYIPVTVFYPLLIIWLGIDEGMKITFLFMAMFFAFLPNIVLMVKGIDKELIDTAYTIGMSKLEIIFRVQLPFVIPNICQSFLMIFSVGWTYVVIAEVVNAKSGLGHIMNIGSARGRTDIVFVGIITIFVISFVFDNLGGFIIKKLFPWKFARQIKQ
ncbi:MAG: ABC transporter permease subunit [Bacillota bacterium]|nr:ABC transporter permease subunit [Bacillota bacterium]